MKEEKIILCVSNAYSKKYYFNEEFKQLPESVQAELKILSVLYTEDVGGVFSIGFYEETGEIFLKVTANDYDCVFDEIGSHLKIKELQTSKKDLWESLELFFKTFYLQ